MLNETRVLPRVARVIGKTGKDAYDLLITDVQAFGRGDYVVTVELPPSGFTREDVAALRECVDHAERWLNRSQWETANDKLLKSGRDAIARIEALLPPE